MLPSEFKRYTDDSQPLVVDPQVATKIGLNESIIIRQIHYWLSFNEKSDKKNNNHEHFGNIYCWNTITEWQEQFPFWSESTIKRAFAELKKLDLISIIPNPKNSWDKTNWYTINYDKYASLFDLIDQVKMNQSISSNCTSPSGQNDTVYKDTETTTENTAEREETPPLETLDDYFSAQVTTTQNVKIEKPKTEASEFFETLEIEIKKLNVNQFCEESLVKSFTDVKMKDNTFDSKRLIKSIKWLNENKKDWKIKYTNYAIQDYLKQENTNLYESETYKKNANTHLYPLVVSQRDNETLEDFEDRCLYEEKQGYKVQRIYIKNEEDNVKIDWKAMKRELFKI